VTDAELLERFIATFSKLDDLLAADPVPPELDGGLDDSPWARQKWRPAAIRTDPSDLEQAYLQLPDRFPPLYEQLVLSYRWLEVELDDLVRLIANPPGILLAPLIAGMTKDRLLVDVLFAHGLIPFGRAPGDNYDPVCFDTRRRNADGDCPIVRIEHEAILCQGKLGESSTVSGSFRSLMTDAIAASERTDGR